MNANQRKEKQNFFLGLTQCDIKKLGYLNSLIYRYIYKCIRAGIIVYNITILAAFLTLNSTENHQTSEFKCNKFAGRYQSFFLSVLFFLFVFSYIEYIFVFILHILIEENQLDSGQSNDFCIVVSNVLYTVLLGLDFSSWQIIPFIFFTDNNVLIAQFS